MPGKMRNATNPETIAVSNGIGSDTAFGAITPPVVLSSNFAFAEFEQSQPFEYSRTSNPTRSLLADTIAKLEGGAGAVVTSSGMAAVDLVLGQLRCGDRVIAPHDCYGGTYRLLEARRAKGHFDVTFVDQGDSAALQATLDKPAALVLVETPSNPLMRVSDIRAVAGLAKAAGARVAVDNTFLSPALQQPLRLGADFVIHSTTKYLNGHSDVVAGALATARDDETWQRIKRIRAQHGVAMLWDAHSIRSVLPRFFEGKLPDLNLGTADGASCDPALAQELLAIARSAPGYTGVLNGRFKGGYITRHYGQPAQHIHAVQLEMTQCSYMQEALPFDYLPEVAAGVQPHLQRMLAAVLAFASANKH